MLTIMIFLNLISSLISALAVVMALVRPAFLSGSKHVSSGEGFYVRMYAARSIPFGLAAGFLPVWLAGPAVAWLLFTAAMVQALDVIVGVRQGAKDDGRCNRRNDGAPRLRLYGYVGYWDSGPERDNALRRRSLRRSKGLPPLINLIVGTSGDLRRLSERSLGSLVHRSAAGDVRTELVKMSAGVGARTYIRQNRAVSARGNLRKICRALQFQTR